MTSESQASKGRRIDRYDIHELIGEGGMGAVYRAVDSRLGRTVALKTVVPQRSGAGLTDELRQRFMREALAASKVEHRNVVQVLDFGLTGDGTPYLVMEYLRGQDLGVLLRKTREPLAIEYVADVMLGVCAALRACHQLGIVHRDLKPSNIFLADTDTGHEIKVLDFGVSKAPMAGDLTQEGQILGTPQYLSPEQVNGKVGPESDQYALGVLLYVCLTKRLPFEEHQNLSLLRAIEVGRFRGPRAHRPEIPQALEAVILRAMHADATKRFESVHVLGQRLWDFASSRGQVEWKNYYFHSPPVAMPAKDTPRGMPLAPAPSHPDRPGAETAPGEIDPTALLAPQVGSTEMLPGSGDPDAADGQAPPSPQLFISTKLARPVRVEAAKGEVQTAPPPSDVSNSEVVAVGRRRAPIVIVVALAIVGVGVGTGRQRFRNSAPAKAPILVPSQSVISRTSVAPLPEVSKQAREPDPSSKPPSRPDAEPFATKRELELKPKIPSQKISATHKKRAPSLINSPKMGLDQNGIGIPSN
jgi:serine/threonine protein kinase